MRHSGPRWPRATRWPNRRSSSARRSSATRSCPKSASQIALSRVNRHGLIAGATGTGKTKTLQIFAGQLSAQGVPVFAVDVKGDLSGIGAPGDATDQRTIDRCTSLAWTFVAAGHPLEILSLSGKTGAHVRASISSFGPLLLGKVLDLNETQTSILSLVFRYCDDQDLPLLDLADLRTTLKFLGSDEGKPVLEDLGGISPASLGVILRAIVTIEQEGADVFFGEPEFDVDDLLRTTADGKGIVTLLEVADVMDKPRLYSTFVLWMLAQLYEALPEVGDLPEAQAGVLLRRGAPAVRRRVRGPARPDRADRAPDPDQGRRRLLRDPGARRTCRRRCCPSSATASSTRCGRSRPTTPTRCARPRARSRSPSTTTSSGRSRALGIGEALVTVLSPKGVPTPLAATRLVPPDSRMAPLSAPRSPQVIAASAAREPLRRDRRSRERPRDHHRPARPTPARPPRRPPRRPTMRDQVSPTTNAGLGTMTPAQQKREIERQARELRKAQEAAERERKAQQRGRAGRGRQREKTIETGIRTAGRVASSRAGQSLLRGVFDTIFGTGKSR